MTASSASRLLRQGRHSLRHLAWRGLIAALADTAMATGVYPLVPHAALAWSRRGGAPAGRGQLRAALHEWWVAAGMAAARPLGFLPLPGHATRGPRPIIVLHGYAMNRSNFVVLARRLAAAGLGPVLGFEYWSLGKTGRAAKRLAEYIEEVRMRAEADEVDLIGHSMGGVVARYYVSLLGGDGVVKHLVTLGSPHAGTEVSAIGLGRPGKAARRLGPAPAARRGAAARAHPHDRGVVARRSAGAGRAPGAGPRRRRAGVRRSRPPVLAHRSPGRRRDHRAARPLTTAPR